MKLILNQPCLPRFLHESLDLTSVIPVFRLLFAPVLVATVFGVCGGDSGSACGRLGARTQTTVQPTPSFAFHRELRTRRARACFGAASNGCLGRIIDRVMSFLKFGCLREGVRPSLSLDVESNAGLYTGHLDRLPINYSRQIPVFFGSVYCGFIENFSRF